MGAIFGLVRRHGSRNEPPPDFEQAACAAGHDPTSIRVRSGPAFFCGSAADSAALEESGGAAGRGETVLVADARLDNRAALLHELGMAATESQPISDALLVLRAHQKWGRECVRHLLGDFAFVIWDAGRRVCFAGRDHAGVRPFYYALAGGDFWFSSDLASLLAMPGVPQQWNRSYLAAHLVDATFEHPELTFFESIRKLPPAHTMTVQPNAVDLRRYWDPADAPQVRLSTDRDYVEAFLEIFQDAVGSRLAGGGPVGAHITGGLDSSSIAVVAAKQLREQGRNLVGFSWAPPPDQGISGEAVSDERSLIALLERQASLQVHYQTLAAADLVAVLRRNVAREPTVDTLVHEQLVQRQAAAAGVHVILSGWGGDELVGFNGRGHLPELLVGGRWGQLYRHCRQREGSTWRVFAGQALLPLAPQWLAQRLPRRGARRGSRAASYLREKVTGDLRAAAAPLLSRDWSAVGLRRMQLQLWELGHLPRRIEAWAATAARQQVEYRYPLLDKRIIEFALGLPAEQFVRNGWTRYLMRNAVEGLVPPQIQWNRDKSDPARSRMLRSVTSEAFAQVAELLAERQTPPGGAEYIDVERLQRRLQSGRPLADAESDHVWHLLQFLDF